MTQSDLNGGAPKRVLIVDDSRTIRALLRATIDADERLEVVGEAADPYEAREQIKAHSPDVLTLDVEMPRMNGLEFLERLMRLRPMPVVMVSTRTQAKSEIAVRALSIGAVECVDVASIQADPARRAALADALVLAAAAKVRARADTARSAAPRAGAEAAIGQTGASGSGYRWNGRVVLVGSSTGGVDAIERLLSAFPADGPPVVIAQHMPEGFLRSFASRLDENVAPAVRLASDGDIPKQGEVLIAPGGSHHLEALPGNEMKLTATAAGPDDLYVPTIDRLFLSARSHAPRTLGVILTGMGRDGAEGLLALKAGGAVTLAQSAESCVVDGMPRAARAVGAVDENVPLDRMGAAVLKACMSCRRADNV